MHPSSRGLTAALVSVSALFALPAAAAVVSTTGLTVITPPTSVHGGYLVAQGLPSQVIFNEQQGVILAGNLITDTGVIAAGTRIDSQFFTVNGKPPIGQKGIWEDTSATFDGKVLGVVFKDNVSAPYGTLFTASDFLGAPGTAYNETCRLCGFDPGTGDTVRIVGSTVFFHSRYSSPGDFARIITAAAPEPSSWGLMVLGMGLAGAALRRRQARNALWGS